MLPGGIGAGELLVVAVVAVLLFGSKLPEVARNLGKTYHQFRKGLSDLQSTMRVDLDSDPPPSRSTNRISHYKDAVEPDLHNSPPRFIAPPSSATSESDPPEN